MSSSKNISPTIELLLSKMEEASWIRPAGKPDEILKAFRTEKVYGIPVDEFMANPSRLLELIDPKEREEVERGFVRLEKEEGEITLEYDIITPDGVRKRVREKRFTFKENGNRYIGAIIMDIPHSILEITKMESPEFALDLFSRHNLQAVYILNSERQIVSLNQMALTLTHELTGMIPKKGEDMLQYILPTNLEKFKLGLEKAEELGSIQWTSEVKKDEERYWIEMYYAVTRDPAGKLKNYIITSRDVTNVRSVQLKNKQRDALYRSVVEMTQDGIVIVQEGKVLYANPRVWEWLELDEKNVTINLKDYVAPRHYQTVIRRHLDRTRGGNPVSNYEIEIKNKKGKNIPVELEVSRIEYQGKPASLALIRNLTERKRKEKELQEAEQKFQSLVEKAPVGIYIYQNGKFIYANPQIAQMLGYEKVEDFGPEMNLIQFIHPEDVDIVQHNIRERLRDPARKLSYTVRAYRKDGSLRYIEVYDILTQFNGRPAILGTIIDNTEKILAEKQIEESEARYRKFFEEDITGDFISTLEGRLIEFNDRYASILGYTREELMAIHTSALYPDAEVRKRLMDELIEKGELKDYMVRMKRKDGREIIIKENVFADFDENGSIKSVRGYLYDITEMEESREKLQESEERLSLAIQASGVGLYDVDLESKEIYVNDQYLKAFGPVSERFEEHEQEWSQRIHPDHRILVLNEFEKLKRGSVDNLQVTYLTLLNGKSIWVREWARVINKTIEGRAKRVVGALSDVTQEMQKELERLELIDELRKQNVNLKQFSYIISHNVRKHVANLLGLFELMEKNMISASEQDHILGMIGKSIRDLDEVILDLDDILYIREGKGVKIEAIEMQPLLEDIESLLEQEIEESRAVLEWNLEEGVIWGVRSYVQSVLYNLINNAIKYRHPDRLPKIRITVKKAGPNLRVEVQDNGIGMDLKKDRSKLFNLYSRLNINREGKGVGLYTVKTQVEYMGGSIDVESDPGKGSTFTVILPGHS